LAAAGREARLLHTDRPTAVTSQLRGGRHRIRVTNAALHTTTSLVHRAWIHCNAALVKTNEEHRLPRVSPSKQAAKVRALGLLFIRE